MVLFGAKTPAYIVFHDFHLIADPWLVFFTPTNHHPAFIVSDQFSGYGGVGANIADQRKSTVGINYRYSAHAIHGRKPS